MRVLTSKYFAYSTVNYGILCCSLGVQTAKNIIIIVGITVAFIVAILVVVFLVPGNWK